MAKRPRPESDTKTQAKQVLKGLIALYPEVRCALDHSNTFELLVATILSAQCTDARVNMVTPALFATYPTPAKMALAAVEDLEQIIHSTGFFRAKAKNLLAMSQALVAEHGGEVPADLQKLTALAGVGRKTAHVVLGNAFQIPSGVVVDTHVKRLSYRLGLTENDDPVPIEHDLAAIIPKAEWIDFSHRLIEHGRRVCAAQRPNCDACPLREICPRHGVPEPKARRSPKSG